MDKKGFTAYLEGKNRAPATIAFYIKGIDRFFKYVRKEETEVSKPDILKYLEHLKNSTRQQNITRQNSLIALNHYFTFLYQDERICTNPCSLLKIRGAYKKRLCKIYTPDELEQLADNFYSVYISGFDDSKLDEAKKKKSFLGRHRNYAMLTLLVYQGLETNELPQINLNDVDCKKARLTLKNRTLPIQAAQMGTLIHYINNIRPLFLDFCGDTDKLFFSLSAEQYDKTFCAPLRKLTGQVKAIDSNFINFSQIRTSVITHWVKSEGLRKSQYMAGHRYINTTEKYVCNNLEDLTNDINKLHPF